MITSKTVESAAAVPLPSIVEGGERTENEWERLSKLPKDELVIELMYTRCIVAAYRAEWEAQADAEKNGIGQAMTEYGDRPPKGWLDRIVAFAEKRESDDETARILTYWGVDGETAERIENGNWSLGGGDSE